MNEPLSYNHSKIFHGGGVERAFRDLEGQTMFLEMLQDTLSTFMMEDKGTVGVNVKVIHIDLQPAFGDYISEDVIHECLKGGWSIAEAEKHDSGFE